MGKNFNQFRGLFLEKAEEHFNELKKNFIKAEVKPYEDMIGEGKKRVVDIRKAKNDSIKIIWSYENYN